MTTVTKTEQTPEAVQAALVRKLAATKDPLDATTDREGMALTKHRGEIEAHVRVGPGLIERLEQPTAQRIVVQANLDRLRAVEPTIEKLIKDAGDWREVADARERDRAWEHQNAVAASKIALHRGVEYFGGKPALPGPLRELLTPPPCASCGRSHEAFWPGPISALEAELKALDKQIAEAEFWLDSHLGSARALLAELVSV
jgi:hypothetical protein